MDLYEALKNGTCAKELEEMFYKELNAAKDRIDADRAEAEKLKEQKQKDEELGWCREDFAAALLDYLETFLGKEAFEELNFTWENTLDALKEFEKDIKNIIPVIDRMKILFKTLPKEKSDKPLSTGSILDDAVIKTFISNLK